MCIRPTTRTKDTHRNPPGSERLAATLYQAAHACQELLTSHGPRCRCWACDDARGMALSLSLFASLFESELYLRPGLLDHVRGRRAQVTA